MVEAIRTRLNTLLRPPAAAGGLHLQPAAVLLILAVLAVAGIALFMTIGARGSWDFVLPFRGRKVWAICVVATAIAASTVLFQTITANRILSPAIMGFDALFTLIRTCQIFFLGGLGYVLIDPQIQFFAETGALIVLSNLLFRWLFSSGGRSLHLLVLVGIVFGVLFRSLSNLMQRLINPNDFAILQDSLFASFNTIDPALLLIATIAIAGCGFWIVRLLPVLDVLALGRETAINLGVDHRRAVTQILTIVAILVSISTALVGPVTFFGLLVANLAYLLIRSHRHALILPAAILLSIICLVGGQAVLEHVFGFNSALSIIIEFVGGIFFIALLLKGVRQ